MPAPAADSTVREVGSRIRRLRLARRMTQEALAGDSLTKSFISQIERGTITPSIHSLRYIAGALGVKMAQLLDDERPHDQAWTLCQVAEAALACDHRREAQVLLERVTEWLDAEARSSRSPEEMDHRHSQEMDRLSSRVMRLQGACLFAEGRLGAAAESLEAGLLLAVQAGDSLEAAKSCLALGRAWHGQERHLKAARMWEASIAHLDAIGAPSGLEVEAIRVEAYAALAQLHAELNDTEESHRLLEYLQRKFQDGGMFTQPVHTAGAKAIHALQTGELGEAAQAALQTMHAVHLSTLWLDLRWVTDRRGSTTSSPPPTGGLCP